jgi:hypothetical protein
MVDGYVDGWIKEDIIQVAKLPVHARGMNVMLGRRHNSYPSLSYIEVQTERARVARTRLA